MCINPQPTHHHHQQGPPPPHQNMPPSILCIGGDGPLCPIIIVGDGPLFPAIPIVGDGPLLTGNDGRAGLGPAISAWYLALALMSPPSLLTLRRRVRGRRGEAFLLVGSLLLSPSSEKVLRSEGWAEWGAGGRCSGLGSLRRLVRVERRVWVVLVEVEELVGLVRLWRVRRREGLRKGRVGVLEESDVGWVSGLPLRREAPGGRSTVATL